jgi:hypothetical protein
MAFVNILDAIEAARPALILRPAGLPKAQPA